MVHKIVCRQAHIWVSRVKRPKRCPTCSSTYLWDLSPLPSPRVPETFVISVIRATGQVYLNAVLHAWELETRLQEFADVHPDGQFTVSQVSHPKHAGMSGWAGSIGFSSRIDKVDTIIGLSLLKIQGDQMIDTAQLHDLRGKMLIPLNQLAPIYQESTPTILTLHFTHIASNTISRFTERGQETWPQTFSTWRLDYFIGNLPSDSIFTQEIMDYVEKYLELWMTSILGDIQILFHVRDDSILFDVVGIT